jgi:hypothetical protein
MYLTPLPDIAGPGLLIGSGLLGPVFVIIALVIMFALIVVIESAVLQLMRWGFFRRSLRASFWMNLASTLVGFTALALVPRYGPLGLFIAWAASVVIEALVLMRIKPGERRRNWLASLVANLVSYALLLLPTYYFS